MEQPPPDYYEHPIVLYDPCLPTYERTMHLSATEIFVTLMLLKNDTIRAMQVHGEMSKKELSQTKTKLTNFLVYSDDYNILNCLLKYPLLKKFKLGPVFLRAIKMSYQYCLFEKFQLLLLGLRFVDSPVSEKRLVSLARKAENDKRWGYAQVVILALSVKRCRAVDQGRFFTWKKWLNLNKQL